MCGVGGMGVCVWRAPVGAGAETEAERHSQAKDNKVCVWGRGAGRGRCVWCGVAGRGVRVCVCVRARACVWACMWCVGRGRASHPGIGQRCVCVCVGVCVCARAWACVCVWCGPGVCVLGGGGGEAVCGVVACSGGSAWVVCVAV